MREYIIKILPFDEFVTKKNSEEITICGYGNVFCAKDYHGDVINRGAFEATLKAHKKKGTMPAMLYEHKDRICGKWTVAQEDQYGLRLEGVVENNEKNSDIVNKILTGKINGLSIGFYLIKASKLNDTRYIKEAELIECSLVERPANAHSRFFPVSREIDYGAHSSVSR